MKIFEHRSGRAIGCACAIGLLASCGEEAGEPQPLYDDTPSMTRPHPHSYARPDEVAVDHLDLDLTVDFEARRLIGRASLTLAAFGGASRLHLDTRDLEIRRVALDDEPEEASFTLGEADPVLGRELTIPLPSMSRVVHIDYATAPEAAAVQWLTPEQTAGGRHPFLFTQSQAILARSWVPCQDTPAVRMTYAATVRVPPELMAVMSAENPTELSSDGIYTFQMPQPVPSYLLALAVGDLEFRALGPTAGVYAEPEIIAAAASELRDTPAMMEAAARLYGPYRWGRYDILVLPPSFPFGGMENPRLTFATPTILAGDRSLVSLIAHELAHSWSGNLVTNAGWDDFWLNEGFTVYLERRIMEEIAGRDYAEMLALLGLQGLQRGIQRLGPESADTHLKLDLAGRDPDDGMTTIAYEKGYFFLRTIEEAVGRERWDAFLRRYFDGFAFRSLTTEAFLERLRDDLLRDDDDLEARLAIDDWVYGPALPPNLPEVRSERFERVDAAVDRWSRGEAPEALDTAGWTTHEWLRFLRGLPEALDPDRMARLDEAFGFTASGNSEVLAAWLERAIEARYEPAYAALEAFLKGMGRRKFLRPLYSALHEADPAAARRLYAEARPTYHSVSTSTIDDIVGWEADSQG